LRQAVYDHLPPADRRRLHLAAAADRVDEALAAELEAETGRRPGTTAPESPRSCCAGPPN